MNPKLPGINHETVVFSKHAKERLDLRRIGEDMVIQVMRKPTASHKIDDGKIKFVGKSMGAKVHAICKPLPEENKWLVITLWVRGEDDAGNFVKYGKSYRLSHRKDRGLYSRIYGLLFALIILVIFFVYYSQAG